MYGAFVVIMLLGGLGAVVFGAAMPATIGVAVVALGAAAFCAGLVHIGMRLWDQESAKK
ncbi:hypothetical protein [Microbacterium natoriense]|jgi:hypothetical protein